MIVESGHFALVLAFIMALVQSAVPLVGAARHNRALMAMGQPAAVAQFLLLLWAFAALTYAFLASDFSVLLVAGNSHASKPFLYKLTGVWGNHEGSMLLWVLMLAAFGAAIACFSNRLPEKLKARTLAVQGMLGVAFLAFSIFTSNPFSRLLPVPFEGGGLNPILQDPALAAHPPLLCAGYVGFSLAFSISVASLMSREISPDWAKWVRPWTLLAWICLTIGIALGSFWAYYELGWGGFWFWDPVENASLMPWLAGTALLHSALVSARRNTLHRWTMLLAILTFGLSVIGTFLVRSGVLTSVHAFATDPARGVFILAIFAVFIGGALVLYAIRSPQLGTPDTAQPFQPVSREGSLMLNNVFLASATATVFIGTLYPLAVDALGMGKISVGAPYFNAVFNPVIAPLLLVMPIGPLLGWGAGQGLSALQKLTAAAVLAVLTAAVILLMQGGGPWGAALGIAGAVWLVAGSLTDLAAKIGLFKVPLAQSFSRLLRLSGHQWGVVLAHSGIGLMVLGIVATTAWRSERVEAVTPGDVAATIEIAGYQVLLDRVVTAEGPNYQAEQAVFQIRQAANGTKKILPEMIAEKRFYPVERQSTTEAAILKRLGGHLYLVLGDRLETGSSVQYVVRVWHHPLVSFIWIGALVMSLGGVLALIGRARQERNQERNKEKNKERRKIVSDQPVQI